MVHRGLKSYLYGLILNLQFFTIIPFSKEVPITDHVIKRSVELFPLLGLIQGGIFVSGLYLFLDTAGFSILASALFLWLLIIIISGAIHLDGWIDCSDAYFSYRNTEKRLDIMSDSRVGAFGVISVIILLAVRFLFIFETISSLKPITYIFILLIPFLGKMFMGLILYYLPLAKDEGMGHFFKKALINQTPWIYFIFILIAGIGIYMLSPQYVFKFIILMSALVLIFIILRKKLVDWFDGITGDVIGANVEGVETFLWMMIWIYHYFGMV